MEGGGNEWRRQWWKGPWRGRSEGGGNGRERGWGVREYGGVVMGKGREVSGEC